MGGDRELFFGSLFSGWELGGSGWLDEVSGSDLEGEETGRDSERGAKQFFGCVGGQAVVSTPSWRTCSRFYSGCVITSQVTTAG